jgi:futalosine hydrolase
MFILFPTLNELKGSLGDVAVDEWKYGILEGQWRSHRIFVTGVTKTNATFASALIFSELKPERALLVGICGAYRQGGLQPGDLVTIEKDWFVDEALFLSSGIRLLGEEGFPVCDGGYASFEPFVGLQTADSNTVSLLGAVDSLADSYYNKTKAQTENMEGAAVGLAALKTGVTVSQVRGVSNYCGDRDKQQWNIKSAFKSLNSFLIKNL